MFPLLIAACPLAAKPPSVMFAYPAGARAGESVKVKIGALDADGAKAVSVSSPNSSAKILSISPMPKDRLKAAADRNEAAGMKFVEAEISISKDAPEGFCDLRLSSPEGASTRYFFEVSNLPEIMEAEPNSDLKTAQAVKKTPVIINGQIYEGDIDCFKFSLKKGKTYVFEIKARAIRPYLADAVPGWFQATLRLKNSKGESVAFADDFQNSPDPVLIYTPESDGDYVIEVQDSLFRGRDDFVYRLKAGILPYIEAIYPCGGSASSGAQVELIGVNLPSKKAAVAKAKNGEKFRDFSVSDKSLKSNSVKFAFGDFPESELAASNAAPAEFSEIPQTFNGVIRAPYEKRYVKFKAEKGEELVFETLSARLGYPCDTKLTVYRLPQMQKIASNDDFDDKTFGLVTAQLDSRLIHKFKDGGDYLLKLEEAQNRGGADFVFRLKISKPEKGVSLMASPSNPQIALGNFAPIKITAIKSGGWDGEIEVFAKDLPQGFSAKKCVIEPKSDSAVLMISAAAGAPQKPIIPKFYATAKVGEKTIELPVAASEELTQAFFIAHSLPIQNVEMSVLPQAPFTLEWGDLPELPISLGAGNTIELDVKIKRQRAFKGKVRIGAYRWARGMQILPKSVEPDEDEFTIQLKANGGAIGIIKDDILPTGYLRDGGKNYIFCLPPIPYVVHGKVVTKFNSK